MNIYKVIANVIALMMILITNSANAFRMIQNNNIGRVTAGAIVQCDDPGGFAHWEDQLINWQLNTNDAFATQAMLDAMDAWNEVNGSAYQLDWGGLVANANFATDNQNIVNWGIGQGCAGNCVALTALVLDANQVIVESDITFRNDLNWNLNGGNQLDVQATLTHELGHSLGIHHSDVGGIQPFPTMRAIDFGDAGRTLEDDDEEALRCSENRYYPSLVRSSFNASTTFAADPRLNNSTPLLDGISFLKDSGDMHLEEIVVDPNELTFTDDGNPNVTDIARWHLLDQIVQRRVVTGNCNGGTCNAALPARNPGDQFALVGFDFRFTNGDHHINVIRIQDNGNNLTVTFADKNFDDPYAFQVEYVFLPANVVGVIGQSVRNNITGRSVLGLGQIGGDRVISGIELDYRSSDHHITEIEVDVSNDDEISVNYRDKNADDQYSYEIDWLEVLF